MSDKKNPFGGFGGFGSFGGFGDFSAARPPAPTDKLPTNVIISGGYPDGSIREATIDRDGRWILVPYGTDVLDKLNVVVPAAAGLIYDNTEEYKRYMTHVSVVNVSANPVTLKLYLADNVTAYSDAIVWAAPGLTLQAGDVWVWQGRWVIKKNHRLGGVASAADSLYLSLGLEKEEALT